MDLWLTASEDTIKSIKEATEIYDIAIKNINDNMELRSREVVLTEYNSKFANKLLKLISKQDELTQLETSVKNAKVMADKSGKKYENALKGATTSQKNDLFSIDLSSLSNEDIKGLQSILSSAESLRHTASCKAEISAMKS